MNAAAERIHQLYWIIASPMAPTRAQPQGKGPVDGVRRQIWKA
jgi:hypothetical protein